MTINLQLTMTGRKLTNLSREEADQLRKLVRKVSGDKRASVRLWTRGSTTGHTDVRVHEGSAAVYVAVLDLIESLGFVTSVTRKEHNRRIEQFAWAFPPGGLTVFKPAT